MTVFGPVRKYGKYLVLFGLVFVGSAFLFTGFVKVPAFCKYLCPSGTFMGAIPLLSTNAQLRTQIGGLFYWKLGLLIFLILLFLGFELFGDILVYCTNGLLLIFIISFSIVKFLTRIFWQRCICRYCCCHQQNCHHADCNQFSFQFHLMFLLSYLY